MRTATANERQKRSWTDQREASPNRMVGMIFLGLCAVSLFLFFVWFYFFGRIPARSFVATLSIKDYKTDVPDIRVGEWDLDKMSKIEGLYPWERPNVNASSQNNAADIEEFFKNLKGLKLDKNKDTAIIQLRCHAAVTKVGSENWNCGLYINDNSSSDKPYPITQFLELAANVPAKNIVIFAEIADLQFEPHLGWVVNPIESYLRKACQSLDWEKLAPDRKVWVVCSNADYQSPLFSVKRGKKTLFQEACEESLREEAFRTRRSNYLTLARYFELIYRHCHTASKGRQTPRLILANKSSEELPAAEEVFISNYKKVASLPKAIDKKQEQKKDSVEPKEGSSPVKEAQNRSGRREVLVSFRQSDAKATQDPKAAKPRALDARIRFWQFRDEINDRGLDKNFWSPRDFAPFAWRKLQADIAKASIWETQESDFTDLAKAMEMLQDGIAKGQPVPLDNNKKGEHWKIVEAWNDFLKSDSGFRRQWQNESTGVVDKTTGLLGEEIETWRKQRIEFRSYIDCLAELNAWIELSTEFASADFSEVQVRDLNADCNRLISELLEQKKWIPQSNTESAADQSKSLQMEKALGFRKSLDEHIEKAIRSSRLDDKKEDLTWLQERKFQVLLSSPLLKYEQRELLVKAMKDLGPRKVVVETDEPLKSIQPRMPVVQVDELEMRCEMLRKSWPLLSNKESLSLVPKDPEKLLDWGTDYSLATMKLDPLKAPEASVDREVPRQSTAAWHFLSLVDPRFALKLNQETQYEKSWSGIVIAPLDPKTIRLSMALQALDFPEGQIDVPLRIKVVHFDGTDVPSCDLKWTARSEIKDFSVKYGANTVRSGQSIPVKPSGKEVVLNCSLRTADSPESGTQILLSTTSPTSKKASNQLAIPMFRNADRIDLIVRRADDSVPLKEKKGSEKKDTWIDLESPAIAGATSEFRFSMSNKKSGVRSVGLKVYLSSSIPNPGKADANLVAIAEFEAELPAMQETPVILKSIEAIPIDPKRKSSPLEKLDALNSILIFEIIEFEIPEVKKEGAAKKRKGTPWRYSARFKPLHPRNFVKAIPGKVEAGSKYSIDFETAPELWKRHGMQELPVLVRGRTMVNGEFTPEKPLQPPMIITSENSKSQFLGSVVNTNTQRFLTDIGGYPRALMLDAIPSEMEMKREYEDQIQIVELRPIVKESIQAAGEKPSSVVVKKFGEYVVFPWLVDGEQVKYRAIEIDTVVDKAPNSRIYYEILKLEGNEEKKFLDPRILSEDRSFLANLRIQDDGSLGLGYFPSELKIRHFEGIETLDGTYLFRVHVGEQQKDQKFIFDKIPPPPSFVDAQGASDSRQTNNDNSRKSITLFKGEKVDMRVDIVDTAGEGSIGAGVDRVEFRLCGVPPLTFDDSTEPALVGLVTPTENRVSMKLDSAAFDGRPKGNYWITAKTIDRAGNFQIRNQPLRVDWRDVERPAPPK